MLTLHPSKEHYMRETFYNQVREEGVLISKEPNQEVWMVKGVTVLFYFSDGEHQKVCAIVI